MDKEEEVKQSQSKVTGNDIASDLNIVDAINFEELWIWWLSILGVVISVALYKLIPVSPIREIIVITAILIFIVITMLKFFK